MTPLTPSRGFSAAAAALVIAAIAPAVASAEVAQNKAGWSTSIQPIYTTITQGYELALDQGDRRLYAADAGGVTTAKSTLVPVVDANGVASTTQFTVRDSTAKVFELSTINNTFVRSVSFTSTALTPFVNPTNNRSAYAYPYGIAVDSKRHIVATTNTRSNTVTIFDGSATAITNANTLFLDSSPTPAPIFAHPMSLGIDSTTGLAYIADNGTSTVKVIDLATKTVTASIPGVVSPTKFAIDEANGIAYVGCGAERGATAPIVTVIDLKTNTVKGTITMPTATDTNTRPGLDEGLQKLYVGSYAGKSVSVFNAKTGAFIKRLDSAGPSNTLTVDSKRHLAYSSDHSANAVTVIDTLTDEVVQVVPTGARTIDVAVDETSGVAYASGQGQGIASTPNFGVITSFKVTKDAPVPIPAPAQGPAGPAGPAGTPGPTGAGLSSLSIELETLKLLGSKVKYEAPGAGVLNVVVKSGGKTIATGKRTSTGVGSYSLTLSKTKTGKAKLAAKKSLKGTLTATFTPKGSTASVSKSIKAGRL